MTVPKHIEVIADDFARRRFHSYAWPEDIEDATAAHAALVEAGLAIVPREPTQAMQHAACKLAPTWDFETNAKKYRAMIEAAEKP